MTCLPSLMRKSVSLTILLILVLSVQTLPSAQAQEPYSPVDLTLTVYSDGFVHVEYLLEVDVAYPRITVTLFGRTFENLLITDEDGLPLDYFLSEGEVTVDTLGARRVKITYDTLDLTSRVGRTWTLTVNTPVEAVITFPRDFTLISLNQVPVALEKTEGQLQLTMPSGLQEIVYALTISAPAPPKEFQVGNLKISPVDVVVGEEITVTVDVVNIGEETGTATVTLKVNGVVEAEKEVTLAGGASQTVSFTLTWDTAGVYEVQVDSLVETITVTKAASVITVSVSPTQIDKGESVTVSGLISPPVPGVEVYLAYMKAGDVVVERTVTTASDGSFTDVYVPDAGGSWSITARWEGNEQYQGAMSSPAGFEVVDKGCVIATATYGSELAAEVQFLRGFRENTVYSTFAGSRFMEVFNAFYYSWSPTVAGVIWSHSALQTVGRMLITPLLGILHVSTAVNSVFSFNPELGIVATGLVASSLIGLVYFFPVGWVLVKAVRRRWGAVPKTGCLKSLLIPWAASLGLIGLAEALASSVLMMVGAGMLVVFTVGLTAGTLALGTVNLLKK